MTVHKYQRCWAINAMVYIPMMIVLIVRPFTIEVVSIPEGILHPDTRFGLAYGTSMVRNWYRDVNCTLVPWEYGIQRGMWDRFRYI